MRLVFPKPELTWKLIGKNWFLDLEDATPPISCTYVGIISEDRKGCYSWNAYSYLQYSHNDIGSGETNSLKEAKKKVEETLTAAGVAK